MSTASLLFSEDQTEAPLPRDPADLLVLQLDGFEGPIDVLLALARDQKVDLAQISVLALAEQYLDFVGQARERNIELAADYLVMAAWLAYLKSRLLLPEDEAEDEPSGEEMAAALAFQLKRLDAMREAGYGLFERKLLGRERFGNGTPAEQHVITRNLYDLTLFDVLKAYGQVKGREKSGGPLEIEDVELYPIDRAIARLRTFLGRVPEWTVLQNFLPENGGSSLVNRSALCSTLIAALELAKSGRLHIRQDGGPFSPVLLRSDTSDNEMTANKDEDTDG